AIALIDAALRQDPRHPSDAELKAKLAELGSASWTKVFPGAATLRLTTDGGGQPVSLRLTKADGIPVHLVKEGEQGATVVAVKKIDSLSYYNMNLHAVAEQIGLTAPRTLAVVRFLKIKEDSDCFKSFQIGKSVFARYSPRAVERMKEALSGLDMKKVWEQSGLYGHRSKSR
ncbi:MAG: hypothetical protein JRM77_08530, partial [Nitrososphaerota archaeon]|nr:hypothetical protein [Nitrososphaerota archaeon]